MLYTYNSNEQTIAANALLSFMANAVRTGCVATHSAGETTISLNRPGYYMVHFNADAVENGTAGNVKIQMQNNGVDVVGAEATAYSGADTDIVNLGFSAIVRVQPNCQAVSSNVPAVLTFVNAGVASLISNAAVVVTKIA